MERGEKEEKNIKNTFFPCGTYFTKRKRNRPTIYTKWTQIFLQFSCPLRKNYGPLRIKNGPLRINHAKKW